MVLTNLFGGAMVAELPPNMIDASDLRQIPDHQEVFLYPESDVSIIMEILQRVPELTDEEAVKFHFEALAHDNDAISYAMQGPSVVRNGRGDQTPSPIILHGSQRIHKFGANDTDDVDVILALFRVHSWEKGKSADLVVSENIPRNLPSGMGEEQAAAFISEFYALVSSLRINDYDLFC